MPAILRPHYPLRNYNAGYYEIGSTVTSYEAAMTYRAEGPALALSSSAASSSDEDTSFSL